MKNEKTLINRRDFIKAGCWGICAMSAPEALSAEPRQERPNLVYVLVDQWRAQATGYAGDPNVKTPNLDRLSKQSVNFQNAVSVCPVCTPHRASLMTGRFPTSTGMFLNDLYLPDKTRCMGEIFQEAGYETAYIGKWHLDGHGRKSYIPPERRQGFKYWKAEECDHDYNNLHYYAGDSQEIRHWEGYAPFAQTQDAQQYLGANDKPFLLMVAYAPPHYPYETAPKQFRDFYPPALIKLPPNVPKSMLKKAQEEACGYYAHCTAIDKCIGDLLETIEESGLARNTIFVFASDHGEMMGSHNVPPFEKQRPWDESICVPFLLRYPAAHGQAGHVIKTPLNTPDIFPTLLSLAGIAIPGSVQGEDLSEVVSGRHIEQDRAALIMSVSPFAGYYKEKEFRGIRTSRYTYARSLQGPWLLYDNQSDPYQMDNLIDKPEHVLLQQKLDKRLWSELKRVGDDFRPAQYYLDKWGYHVDNQGNIPCPEKQQIDKVQSPKPQI